jgi:hypothetical protein
MIAIAGTAATKTSSPGRAVRPQRHAKAIVHASVKMPSQRWLKCTAAWFSKKFRQNGSMSA